MYRERTQLCLAPDSTAYIRYCAENLFMELARNTLRLLSALPGVSALIYSYLQLSPHCTLGTALQGLQTTNS